MLLCAERVDSEVLCSCSRAAEAEAAAVGLHDGAPPQAREPFPRAAPLKWGEQHLNSMQACGPPTPKRMRLSAFELAWRRKVSFAAAEIADAIARAGKLDCRCSKREHRSSGEEMVTAATRGVEAPAAERYFASIVPPAEKPTPKMGTLLGAHSARIAARISGMSRHESAEPTFRLVSGAQYPR